MKAEPEHWWGEKFGRRPQRGKIVTRKELAKLLDLTASGVARYEHYGMPLLEKASRSGAPDKFDVADVMWWLIDYKTRQQFGEGVSSLKLRKVQVALTLREFELQQRSSQLLPSEIVTSIVTETFAKVSEIISQVAKQAAPLVAAETDANKCRQIIAQVINEAREKLNEVGSNISVESKHEHEGRAQ
jgi:hypothetical protein